MKEVTAASQSFIAKRGESMDEQDTELKPATGTTLTSTSIRACVKTAVVVAEGDGEGWNERLRVYREKSHNVVRLQPDFASIRIT